jgi:hypothetical protein
LKNIAEPMNVYTIEVGVPAQLAQLEPARRTQPSPPRSAAIGIRWRPAVLAGALAVGMFIAGAYAPRLYQAYRTVGLTDVSEVQGRAPRQAVSPSTNLRDDPDREFRADQIGYDRKGDAFKPTRSSTNDSYFYKNQSTVEEYRVRRTLRSNPRLDSKPSEVGAEQGTNGSEETYVRRRINTLAEEMNAGPGMNEPFGSPDPAISPDRHLPNNPLLRITNDR